MNHQDWEDGHGETCPQCGQETFRILDNMCPKCAAKKANIEEIRRNNYKVPPGAMMRSVKVGQYQDGDSCYYEMEDAVTHKRWIKQVC